MKTDDDFLDANGNPAKIIVVLKGGDVVLKEYTKDESSASECFVLTAPSDILSVRIDADAHTAHIFDLEVDGILRASVSGKRKDFHDTINKVCYKGRKGKRRDGAKFCGMQVKERDTSKGKWFLFILRSNGG